MNMCVEQARPVNVEAVAAILREANVSGSTLIPQGGGTALAIGNAGSDAATLLDLTGLSGVTSYQPADLTVSLAAGTRVSELLATLAEHGQELPVDVALPEVATIGGLMATGFAGPRRLGSGTLKDLILGCTYVRGDGLVAKAGGSVVKNVSGFEIPRLLHGSWGSLAVITSINFKVTPIPKSEVTSYWPVESIELAVEQAQQIRQQFASVVSIEVDSTASAATVLVRMMGRPGALSAQSVELGHLFGAATTITDDESRHFWRSRIDRFAVGDDQLQLVLATRPRYIREATEMVLGRLDVAFNLATIAMSPAVGSARIRLDPNLLEAAGFWAKLDVASLPGTASASIEFAPETWKSEIDVWGSRPDGTGVMQAIKAEFDPANVLNRQRLFI